MELIQQGDPDGCVSACVAMVTGRTYVEVRKASGGVMTSFAEILHLLAHFGHVGIPLLNPRIPQERCALLACVPSLNVKGGNHEIVLTYDPDGTILTVLDPNKGVDGKLFYGPDGVMLRSWTELIWVYPNLFGETK